MYPFIPLFPPIFYLPAPMPFSSFSLCYKLTVSCSFFPFAPILFSFISSVLLLFSILSSPAFSCWSRARRTSLWRMRKSWRRATSPSDTTTRSWPSAWSRRWFSPRRQRSSRTQTRMAKPHCYSTRRWERRCKIGGFPVGSWSHFLGHGSDRVMVETLIHLEIRYVLTMAGTMEFKVLLLIFVFAEHSDIYLGSS